MGVYIIGAANSINVTNNYGISDNQPTTVVINADGSVVNVVNGVDSYAAIYLTASSIVQVNGHISHYRSSTISPVTGAISMGTSSTVTVNVGAGGSIYSYNDRGIHGLNLGLGSLTVNNAGTITSWQDAIYYDGSLLLNNSGTIDGKVYCVYGEVANSGTLGPLEGTQSLEVVNTGTIDGITGTNVEYHGEGGFLSGRATLSSGDNSFFGGTGREVVRVDGGGTNTIAMGGGNDLVFIDFAFGTIDGGAGQDEVAMAGDAAGPANINLVFGVFEAPGAAHFLFTNVENASGGVGNDSIIGNTVANVLDGGGGKDTLTGGLGNDIYVVDSFSDRIIEAASQGYDIVRCEAGYALGAGQSIEYLSAETALAVAALNLTGNNLAQVITGNYGTNVLSGLAGNDRLYGFAGNDVVNGGAGNDVLSGGVGNDAFVFNSALNTATNVDTIVGYSVADDTIRLENTGAGLFNALAVGTLAPAAFAIGAAATTAAHRIVYNSATGALSYDTNGNGAGGVIKFAQLGTGLAMTNADFVVI